MRIVGEWRRVCVLGVGLAMVAFAPAFGQTVYIGGDWRPQVAVDNGVLDRLGPEPTLPDLLLGRRPFAPAGGPVQLHPPRHVRAQAPGLKPLAEAQPPAAPKPAREIKAAAAKPPKAKERPIKIAQAETKPPAPPAAAAPAAPQPAEPKTKTAMAATLDAPPPPRHTPPPANADMPQLAPGELPTSPAERKMTPPAAKSIASTPAPAAPAPTTPKLAMAAPPPPAPAATPLPPPAPIAAPAATPPATSSAPSVPPAPPVPAKSADTGVTASKQALMTPPPPMTNADQGGGVSVRFAVDGADISDDAKRDLVDLAKRLEADPSRVVQVLAYASGDDASKARRLSLTRALNVVAFLKDQGLHSNQIETRALGNKVPQGSADRVDLVEQKH